jgi:predicted CXXCH cytochrome family protein
VDDRCVPCHTDKRGPFVFEHDMATTADGCLTCHQAHGSPNNKLLKLNGRGLCLQCHSDIALDPAHLSRPGNCWRAGCHADIHGSQESRVFLRATSATTAGVATARAPQGGRGLFAARSMEFAHLAALLRTEESSSADQETGAPAGESPAPEAPSPPGAARQPLTVDAFGAYQNLNVSGNPSKAFQYTVPPDGLFLPALRFDYWDPRSAPVGSGQWTQIDEARQTAALRLGNLGPTGAGPALRYGYDRAAFFIEPSPDPRDSSDRKTQALLLRWLPTRRGPEARFVATGQRVEAPGVSRLATDGTPGALDYSAETYVPQVLLPLGGGNLRLQYAREEFSDRTHFLPGARSDGGFARYDRFVGTSSSLFAAFGHSSLEQGGLPGHATYQQFRVGGATVLAPRLTAMAHLTLDDISQPNTLNAYVQDPAAEQHADVHPHAAVGRGLALRAGPAHGYDHPLRPAADPTLERRAAGRDPRPSGERAPLLR